MNHLCLSLHTSNPHPLPQTDKNQNDAELGGLASAADAVAEAAAPAHIPLRPMESMEAALMQVSWVVPISENQELEQCMRAMVSFIDSGQPEDESVGRLLSKGFRWSWERLLNDHAVSGWNPTVLVRMTDGRLCGTCQRQQAPRKEERGG